jgi:hypothetical protein
MKIVNTFISDGGALPDYVRFSIQKARETNPDVELDFICKDDQPIFEEFDVNWVPQDELSDGDVLKEFNNVCDFRRHGTPNTSYPSPELFWHRTCERLYYLDEYLNRERIYDAFHFENDVLVYGDLRDVPTHPLLSLTPMSVDQVTFAFAHIPTPQHTRHMCLFFNQLLEKGEQWLMQNFGFDHVSEMSLLHVAHVNNMFCPLPTIPNFNEDHHYIFDPGSYGQYLGGTNNGHGSGFIDQKHMIGSAMLAEEINAEFTDRPYVIRMDGERFPIFNLHVHSKNLERFV